MTLPRAPLKRFVDPTRPITYGIVQAGEHVPDGVPYIRPIDMSESGGVVDPGHLLRTTPEIATSYARSEVRAGDLIVSIGPSFGKVMIVPAELAGANLTQGTARVAPAPGVFGRWLFWVLQSALVRGFWSASIGGATFRALNLGPLTLTPVPLTDTATQRNVAALLDHETARIDDVAASKGSLIRLLQERRVEMRRISFGVEGGRVRVPWLPPIPDSWQVLPLRWVTTCLDGRRVPLNAEHRSAMRGGDFPYWGANGIVDRVDDYLFDEDLVLIGEDGAPFYERTKDVAFSVDGPIWVNNHIHVLRPTAVRPLYLAHYLNLVDYAGFITGTTRDKLTQEQLGQIPVPVPPTEHQVVIERRLTQVLSDIDRLVTKLQEQIALLREHRQSLITTAVTGEVDVTGQQT